MQERNLKCAFIRRCRNTDTKNVCDGNAISIARSENQKVNYVFMKTWRHKCSHHNNIVV